MKMEKDEALDIWNRVKVYSRAFGITKTKEVLACQQCKGVGFYYTEELMDYHKREYDDVHHTCRKCAGTGRIVVTREAIYLNGKTINDRITEVSYDKDPITKNEQSTFSIPFEIKTE